MIDRFLEDCTLNKKYVYIKALYNSYLTWCDKHGIIALTKLKFCKQLNRYGYSSSKHGHPFFFDAINGLTLKDWDETAYQVERAKDFIEKHEKSELEKALLLLKLIPPVYSERTACCPDGTVLFNVRDAVREVLVTFPTHGPVLFDSVEIGMEEAKSLGILFQTFMSLGELDLPHHGMRLMARLKGPVYDQDNV